MVLDCLRVVVDVFDLVVGGFRSFHVLVTTDNYPVIGCVSKPPVRLDLWTAILAF